MGKFFIWREIFSYLSVIVLAGGLALFLNKVVVVNAQIPSESMENTIMVGDRIFGNRLAYISEGPRACLKIHSRQPHAPLCSIFAPYSVAVARYSALMRNKSPTNCDARLT